MLFPKDIARQQSKVPLVILLVAAILAQILLLTQSPLLAIIATPILWFFTFWETQQTPPNFFRFLKDGRFFYAEKPNQWIKAELKTLYFWHPLLISVTIKNEDNKKRTFCLYRSQFSAQDFRHLRLFFKFLALTAKADDLPR